MASIILQAGDKRLLSANATLMIHDGTIPMVNTDQEAKNGEKWADESRRLRELFYKIYQKRMREVKPRVTIREIEDMCKYDNLIVNFETKCVDYLLSGYLYESLGC